MTKLKCSMISLWMLSGVTMWKNSCAAMSVTRLPTESVYSPSCSTYSELNECSHAPARGVAEMVEEGVPVDRQLAQEPAGGVQHAAHGGEQLASP